MMAHEVVNPTTMRSSPRRSLEFGKKQRKTKAVKKIFTNLNIFKIGKLKASFIRIKFNCTRLFVLFYVFNEHKQISFRSAPEAYLANSVGPVNTL